jgi:hypothetical protein
MGIFFYCSHYLKVTFWTLEKCGNCQWKRRWSAQVRFFARIIYGDNDNTFEKILAKILA